MSLQEIYISGSSKWGVESAEFTDKDSFHSYLPVYERIFENRKSIRMLEIGILSGGSMWLWQHYFREQKIDYEIIGMDILSDFYMRDKEFQHSVISDSKIQLRWNTDSMKESSYTDLPEFDIIIDDGMHSLESQIASVTYALPKLAKNGVFVVEDVINQDYLPILERLALTINPNLRVERHLGLKDGRPDDIMLMFFN